MLPKRRFLPLVKQMSLFGLLAFFAVALNTTPCQAGAGDLDPTFGDGGIVTTDIGGDYNYGSIGKTILQQDGKLIAAAGSGGFFHLLRFNPDGTLDESFGENGDVTGSNPTIAEVGWVISDIALQPNGKIILGGQTEDDFLIVRYNPDGTLDTTFGTEGKVKTDFSSLYGTETKAWVGSLAVQDDGTILAMGGVILRDSDPYETHAIIVRYSSEGILDGSFGTEGVVIFDLGFKDHQAKLMILQPDEKILVFGVVWDDIRGYGILVRYNSDGTLDPTFGSDGIVSVGHSSYAMGLQSNGKILFVGHASAWPEVDCGFGMYRYNDDGSPDLTFGSEGKVITNFGCTYYPDIPRYDSTAYHVAIQPDDKIVAFGEFHTGLSPEERLVDFALAKYNPDGSPDQTFGDGGKVITEFESRQSRAASMVLQPDGKIIAAGNLYTYPFHPKYFPHRNPVLLRYNTDGSFDADFGTDGQVIFPVHWTSDDEAMDVIALQSDGKILVGGNTSRIYDKDFALVRYNSDGSVDPTFGEKGRVTADFTFEHEQPCAEHTIITDEELTAIAVQPDGKILAVGISTPAHYNWCVPGIQALAMARYLPDGNLDATFGNGGRVLMYESVSAQDIAIQPDGKIVVVAGLSGKGFTVFRFNPDGSPDLGFGSGGIASIDPFDLPSFIYAETLNAVALQPDGKIVVAGSFNIFYPFGYNHLDRWTLFRFNPDGSLDTSFGEEGAGGVAVFFGGSFCDANDLALQPDGKIVVTGSAGVPFSSASITLVRYLEDGTFDPNFGSAGLVYTDFDLASNALAPQPDGRIVVAGVALEYYENSEGNFVSNRNFGLLRYNPDGSLDYTFGDGGKVTTEFGSTDDLAETVTIQADGKILVVGSSSQRFAGKGLEIAIARYEGLGNVVIDGCDSGVLDQVYNDRFISQWVRDCETDAKNHGQFVSCVAHFTNNLKEAGLITDSDKGAIESCAAQANIP